MKPAELIGARIRESLEVKERLLAMSEEIAACGTLLVTAYRAGKKVVLFGNGGSASDALHIAAELVGRFKAERRALPALALSTNDAAVTAISNDYGFEQVFARQIEAFVDSGDVVIAITTSGKSANVLRGIEAARNRGARVIGLTGASGGALRELCDRCLAVPSSDTPRIQEAHILVGHLWCELVDAALS